ncbi:hypothetical protein [Notoacmeibacter ruber]|nr:hypothetical protein [Notoacmeibacter ruber]
MATLSLVIRGDGIPRFEKAVETLGSRAKATRAFRRGLNRVNATAFTRTKRALAPQVGLSQGKLVRLGAMKKVGARGTNLEAKIVSHGNIPAKAGDEVGLRVQPRNVHLFAQAGVAMAI